MDIRFGDHPSFHRAAAGMVGAGALLGLGLHLVSPQTPLAPLAGGLAGMAIGASIVYGKPAWRIGTAVAACALLGTLTPGWPLLAAVAAVMALSLGAFGVRGVRGALSLLFAAVTVLVAMWAALRVSFAHETTTWPAWARDVTSSAAMGMIGVLALLPRHVRVALDPVRAAARRLPSELDGEVRELCARALAIWSAANDKLADSDPGKRLVRDGVLKTLEVAAKSSEVKPAGASEEELERRMADLDQRIAAASDSEVKAQYQAARAALDDQRRYRDHIRQNRERLVARMHNHVAALEKFQLAASGLVAARAATAGAAAVKQLDELSNDVAASGEALAELELGGGVPDTNAVVARPAEAAG